MFTPELIEARVHERPFAPFRVVTSSGEMYDVHHPELIMVGKRALIIGTPSADDPKHFDLVARVAMIHVTALQDLPTPTPPGGER